MKEEVLRMHDVTLIEQGNIRLEDFSLSVFAGEIVGLLPMNDHGIIALIDLLQNNLPLQSGYVYYRGELINCWRTADVHVNRIGVIQNASSLVEQMTVADNIFVLRYGFRARIIREQLLLDQLQPVLDGLGMHIAADAYVDTLTSFEKVVVELVKAVVAGYRLIILREISTSISDQELARLHEVMRHYAAEGISFLYIGYHYEELIQVCDRTAVYSNGRILKYVLPSDGALPYKARYEQQAQMFRQQKKNLHGAVLEVERLCGGHVQDLSFSVSAGECIVIQDMLNTVIGDLVDLLSGEKHADLGEIRINGKTIAPGKSRELAIVSEQPDTTMIFPELSYLDNLCLTVDHRLTGIWSNRRLRAGLRKEWAQRVGDEVFDMPAGQLTRRQRRELVFQRILLQRPEVVFCVQPFKGADMNMRMHVWEQIKALMDEGIALVILTVNLADTLTLATRLVRVEQGSVRTYERDEFDHLPFNAPWLQLYKHVLPVQKREIK